MSESAQLYDITKPMHGQNDKASDLSVPALQRLVLHKAVRTHQKMQLLCNSENLDYIKTSTLRVEPRCKARLPYRVHHSDAVLCLVGKEPNKGHKLEKVGRNIYRTHLNPSQLQEKPFTVPIANYHNKI